MNWYDIGNIKDKMFNKIKKGKTMIIDTIFDDLLTATPHRRFRSSYTNAFSNFDVNLLDNGKQEVTIPVMGHNPKDITVDVTEDEITIKAKKGENTSRFVKDIELSLSVGADYDGTKTEAKFDNGLLTLLIDKKVNKKAKTVKISY